MKYTKLNFADIGLRLKQLRGELSQSDFANFFDGMTQADVSRFEKGKFNSKLNILFNVCERFGCDLDWLLTGKTHEEKKSNDKRGDRPDAEIAFIIDYLTRNPEDKLLIIQLIKSKIDIKKAAAEFQKI
ncbi:MAG TPA: helix-turn-helix transcriptional regulator [Candidatus Wallbacteria bacterium]|nr:helix-turn-helix transcriptional regulator [Candidatus Wallbacteria bacterium]HPG59449.1 helix-turn-helix transcriptional regulator [Candidatus Wallbacteria bacterium]